MNAVCLVSYAALLPAGRRCRTRSKRRQGEQPPRKFTVRSVSAVRDVGVRSVSCNAKLP
ncbi:hypothetical protein PR001_g18610 [Phytophthora rubi]|uniref:Uncharacterized protein n=1 Tax=Phytophthora rubi TaxID=129364 RepID=A0A6A3K1Y0_9STRA|nr:hypothetical protein PR001_g18610 [Phytophthora rubi]